MSETERFEGSGYTVIAWQRREKLVYFREYGSYQGEWCMVTRGDKHYYIFKDYYGSCSGCDDYQATFDWNQAPTRETAKEFCAKYPPFAEVPIRTMIALATAGTVKKILPLNVREMDYDEAASDISLNVRLIENLDVTVDAILKCTNMELQQEAIQRIGYESFLREANAETTHVDGENSLLSVRDIRFVSVKDSSTERRYLLRVPPQMQRVRQAIAWTFGMSEDEYQPIIET